MGWFSCEMPGHTPEALTINRAGAHYEFPGLFLIGARMCPLL
jgi:hypothetical protein